MKKWSGLSILIVVCLISFVSPTFASIRPGTTCPSAGLTKVFAGKKYACMKSGSKLVWGKVLSVKKPTPTPTPTAKPTFANLTFETLLENSLNVSYTAWKKASDLIEATTTKNVTPEIYTGSNTKPFYENPRHPISLVSRLFPNFEEPGKIIWIRYTFKDLAWAESQAKEKLTSDDYRQISVWQGGSLAESNCDVGTSNCRGAYQHTGPSGVAVIMQGIPNNAATDSAGVSNDLSGMVEAHEYFHSLQRIQIMNRGIQVWPHAWWREGSADWVKDATINYQNYENYKTFLNDSCSGNCMNLSEVDIEEFLKTAIDNHLPSKFDPYLNYSLGSHIIEILASIRGPAVLLDMYTEMGKGLTFNDSFSKLFSTSWETAIPFIAKSIYVDLHPERR